jgi:hypothetical protein
MEESVRSGKEPSSGGVNKREEWRGSIMKWNGKLYFDDQKAFLVPRFNEYPRQVK